MPLFLVLSLLPLSGFVLRWRKNRYLPPPSGSTQSAADRKPPSIITGRGLGPYSASCTGSTGPLVTVDVGLSKIVMLGKHEVAHKMLAERGAKLLISSLISLQDTCYSSAKESASDSHSTSYLLIYIILFTHTPLALMKY